MRNTDARCRYTGAWLLLAIGTWFSTVAYAGQGVWTTGGPVDSGWISALAINPATPSTLYAAAVDAIFKSTDSGGTWAILAPTSGFYYYYSALAVDPSTPATLYAGRLTGALNEFGLLKSIDSGGTWTVASTGLTNPSVRWSTSVRALAINPATPSTLYAGGPGGVFRSTDSAGTWAAANTGLTSMDVLTLAINPATPSTLYAGGVGGVFKSTDSGGTWAAAYAGFPGFYVAALAINPVTPATLYAGTLVAASSGPKTPVEPGPLPTRDSRAWKFRPWPSMPQALPRSTPGQPAAASSSPATPATHGPQSTRACRT